MLLVEQNRRKEEEHSHVGDPQAESNLTVFGGCSNTHLEGRELMMKIMTGALYEELELLHVSGCCE